MKHKITSNPKLPVMYYRDFIYLWHEIVCLSYLYANLPFQNQQILRRPLYDITGARRTSVVHIKNHELEDSPSTQSAEERISATQYRLNNTENFSTGPRGVVEESNPHSAELSVSKSYKTINSLNPGGETWTGPTGQRSRLKDSARPSDDSTAHTQNILLTSVGRSGSSFLGELLASQGHNMYFYEPVRVLNKTKQSEEGSVRAELLRNFRCDIRPDLLKIGKSPFVNVKHPYTREKKSSSEVAMSVLMDHCRQEPIRIIKTIRTPLKWIKRIMDDRELQIKVIHLVRDPRGSSLSMANLDWPLTPDGMCSRILQVRQSHVCSPVAYTLSSITDLSSTVNNKSVKISTGVNGKNLCLSILYANLSSILSLFPDEVITDTLAIRLEQILQSSGLLHNCQRCMIYNVYWLNAKITATF